ncbi:MAG: hypothetical protein ACRCVN_04560 [Spirochaetia bacterium]
MKMSKEDVKALAENVRSVYRQLSQMSAKYGPLGASFEDRYHATISNRSDEGAFLHEELLYAQAVMAKERREQEIREESVAKVDHSAIEKELEKYRQRIEAYPAIEIPGIDLEPELARLFGGLTLMDKQYWVFIDRFFRDLYPIRAKSPMEALSNQFIRFVSASSTNIPQALAYYVDELRRGDDDKADDMAYAVVKEVAFFLNEVIYLLDKDNFDSNHPAYVFMTDMIRDFRLSEIKKRHNS